MNNNINKNTVNQMTPEYPINPLPGQALQGSILFTTTDFTKPPVSNANLIWMAMEDIIGTADIKVEFDVDSSTYHLYKAKGHLDDQEVWHYTWDEVANWVALTEEVQEALLLMKYIAYNFEDTGNGMRVIGIDKAGEEHLLVDVEFADKAYVDAADNTLRQLINDETTRATNREDELEEMIKKARPLSGIATDTTADDTNGTKINVRYNKGIEVNNNNQLDVKIDEDTIKEDSNGDLYADNVRDNLNSSDKYTYSIDKIKSLLTSSMIYMGSVATQADLPNNYTLADRGKVWNVLDTGENFAWTGTEWDPLGGMYVEGLGIKIENNTIETRIDTSKGLGYDSLHRVYGKIDTNKGLQYQSNGKLELKLDETKGVDIDANDGKLKAKIDTDKGLQFDSTDGSIEVKLNTNKGVEFDTDGKIQTKIGNGLEFDSNGRIIQRDNLHSTQARLLRVSEVNHFNSNLEMQKTYTYTVTASDIEIYKNRFVKASFFMDTFNHFTAVVMNTTVRLNDITVYKVDQEARNQDQLEGDIVLPFNFNSLNAGDTIKIILNCIESVANTDGVDCLAQIAVF